MTCDFLRYCLVWLFAISRKCHMFDASGKEGLQVSHWLSLLSSLSGFCKAIKTGLQLFPSLSLHSCFKRSPHLHAPPCYFILLYKLRIISKLPVLVWTKCCATSGSAVLFPISLFGCSHNEIRSIFNELQFSIVFDRETVISLSCGLDQWFPTTACWLTTPGICKHWQCWLGFLEFEVPQNLGTTQGDIVKHRLKFDLFP